MTDPVALVIPAWTETLDHLDEALASARGYMRPIVVVNGPGDIDAANTIVTGHTGVLTVPLGTEHQGCHQCNARNKGLEWAAQLGLGWVVFLDADDVLLDGIDQVVDTAQQGFYRGAYGATITAWADGSNEQRRLDAPPSRFIPHHGSYVLRLDACPLFDVWAPHQVPYKGVPYGYRFWTAVGDDSIAVVDVDALMYRHQWSGLQAGGRYWEAGGFIGNEAGAPWLTV